MSRLNEPSFLETLLGDRAARVPAWYYLRNHGEGVVSFVGAAKMPDNPLLFGTKRDLRFCNGEAIFRPAYVIGTDVFQGWTMGQLLTNSHNPEWMMNEGQGEVVFGDPTCI
jgi:hypothetical protein